MSSRLDREPELLDQELEDGLLTQAEYNEAVRDTEASFRHFTEDERDDDWR